MSAWAAGSKRLELAEPSRYGAGKSSCAHGKEESAKVVARATGTGLRSESRALNGSLPEEIIVSGCAL